MVEYMKKEVVEDVVIVAGLIGVQFFFAGNSVLLGYLMSLGLKPFTIVIFFSFSTFLVVSPFAVHFERSKWPKQLTLKLIIQLVSISFSGVSLFQFLFLKGINLSSPAMATAMPNLAPALIFIIAWTCSSLKMVDDCCCRLEKVALSCLYSKVKIAGTILCVLGALTMSLMQSTVSSKDATVMPSVTDVAADMIFDKDKIAGCLYLVAAVFVLSSNIVLQAITLGDLPAPMSLCAVTSFIGMIITAIFQLVEDHALQWGSPFVSFKDLIIFSLMAGAMGGACVSFNGWAMKKRGPVFVSMFSPIGTVIAVVFSFVTLGETISLGSFAGMLLMFTGLYVVLWAKRKELYCDIEEGVDAEKPLLN
ncbi:WAT1-related protein [Gossypium australe]|uniref:WAT1-related protein n=1 Tax=Gossypium australe TaxID=47621 RepID=A0A5B6UBS8_9ROSI|nr:WAT1-related protein [Gossypium australe]